AASMPAPPTTEGTGARRRAYAAGGLKGAHRSVRVAQCRCDAASGADEIVMPTLFIGILAVILALWLLKSYARSHPRYRMRVGRAFRSLAHSDPPYLMKLGRTAGGVAALAGAAFLGWRGQMLVAVALGVTGLGLLGWEVPAWMPTF